MMRLDGFTLAIALAVLALLVWAWAPRRIRPAMHRHAYPYRPADRAELVRIVGEIAFLVAGFVVMGYAFLILGQEPPR